MEGEMGETCKIPRTVERASSEKELIGAKKKKPKPRSGKAPRKAEENPPESLCGDRSGSGTEIAPDRLAGKNQRAKENTPVKT